MHWMVKIVAKALLPALLAVPFAAGQTAAPHSIEDVLHQMSDQAAVIFIGQVIAIHPHLDPTGSSGYVEVDFQVDQPIRGCSSGIYTLREWAGLWQGGANRYRAGQRLLMFLRAPAASGLSSPVDGTDGAVPLRPGGAASLPSSSAITAGGEVVDLRWLGAQVERSGDFTLQTALSPTPLTLAQQMSPAPAAEPLTATTDISRASVPVQQASVGAVMKLLLSWQKASPDAAH